MDRELVCVLPILSHAPTIPRAFGQIFSSAEVGIEDIECFEDVASNQVMSLIGNSHLSTGITELVETYVNDEKDEDLCKAFGGYEFLDEKGNVLDTVSTIESHSSSAVSAVRYMKCILIRRHKRYWIFCGTVAVVIQRCWLERVCTSDALLVGTVEGLTAKCVDILHRRLGEVVPFVRLKSVGSVERLVDSTWE